MGLATTTTATPYHPLWFRCVTITSTPSVRHCWQHAIVRQNHHPTGWWRRCHTVSANRTLCVRYPRFWRPTTTLPRVLHKVTLWTTYYCLTSLTSAEKPAGPGVVASYILPWGAHVRDTTTGWEGYVADHPDSHTQADEWLPCPQRAFPTGYHLWQILSP